MATARLRLCWILLGLLASSPARAGERVDELYRTPFGAVHRTQVDETDGSVWMLAGANMLHLAADGSVLSVHSPGVINADQLLRDPTDGSYWVSGLDSGMVVRMSADGRVRWRASGLGRKEIHLLHHDPTDKSLTVLVGQSVDGSSSSVIHLSGSGVVRWTASVDFPFGLVAVNATDGSVWVMNAKNSRHYGADGTVLWQGAGVPSGSSLVVNSADGSCWYTFPDYYTHAVIHLASDGTELNRYSDLYYPTSLALDTHDGSVWVMCEYEYSGSQPAAVHVAADGTLLGRYTNLVDPLSPVLSDAPPGSLWVVDHLSPSQEAVVHLASDGSELWRAADFHSALIAGINPAEGSVWLEDRAWPGSAHPDWVPSLRRITAEGQEAFRIIATGTYDAGVDPRDNSFWFGGEVFASVPDNCADAWSYHVTPTHLSATGEVLWQHREIWLHWYGVAGNAQAGACWVGDKLTGEVVSLTPEGAEQWRRAAPLSDGSQAWLLRFSADSPDGSGWVAANTPPPCSGPGDKLYHLAENGAELWSVPDMHGIGPIAGNRSDGSCWVLERCDTHSVNRLTRFAANGARLWTLDPSPGYGMAVNPVDGSAWLTSPDRAHLTHVSADGVVLGATLGTIGGAGGLVVNPLDGSVWVYEYSSRGLLHFSAAGELLLRTDRVTEAGDASVAVDASDGSVWLSDMGGQASGWQFPTSVGSKVLHLAPDGTELWRSTNFSHPASIWVHPSDHTVWVNDLYNNQLVHLGVVRSPFLDLPADSWAFDYIRACVNAGIVSGYPDGTYRPTLPVTRDQMAVFISRALAGGDANVPTGPATATFGDVPTSFWAFKYVEYARAQGVAGGYDDGTYRPAVPVDRGQMAVFVARAIAGGDSGVPTGPSTATFPDVPTDYWAFRYIEYIKNQGVTGGYPDGTYRPAVVVTRDQMAVFVQRAFDLPM